MVRLHADLQQIGKEWNQGGKTAKKWGRKNPAVVYAMRHPKAIKKVVRLHLRVRRATAAPPLGPTLGQYGIPIMQFCEQFNVRSKIFKRYVHVVVVLKQLYDNSFIFGICQPMTSTLLKRVGRILRGSGQAGRAMSKLTLFQQRHEYLQKIAALQARACDPLAVANSKYTVLAHTKRRIGHGKRYMNKRKRKHAQKRSFHLKYKNMIGKVRVAVYTPEQVYEVCKLKYEQYFYGQHVVAGNTESELVALETKMLELKKRSIADKYREIMYAHYMQQAHTHLPAINTYIMQSLWRQVLGTMRSMGIFLYLPE